MYYYFNSPVTTSKPITQTSAFFVESMTDDEVKKILNVIQNNKPNHCGANVSYSLKDCKNHMIQIALSEAFARNS
jgi:hypothetical protein